MLFLAENTGAVSSRWGGIVGEALLPSCREYMSNAYSVVGIVGKAEVAVPSMVRGIMCERDTVPRIPLVGVRRTPPLVGVKPHCMCSQNSGV